MTKKPAAPESSFTTVSPAETFRSLNVRARLSSSFLSRSEKSGTRRRSSVGAMAARDCTQVERITPTSHAGCAGAERPETRADHRVGLGAALRVAGDGGDELLSVEGEELGLRARLHGRRAGYVAEQRDLAKVRARPGGARRPAARNDVEVAVDDDVEAVARLP